MMQIRRGCGEQGYSESAPGLGKALIELSCEGRGGKETPLSIFQKESTTSISGAEREDMDCLSEAVVKGCRFPQS